MGFPCGSTGKESTHNARDLGLIPGLGRCPGEEKGYPLQYSGLENSVHGVTKSWTELTFTFIDKAILFSENVAKCHGASGIVFNVKRKKWSLVFNI